MFWIIIITVNIFLIFACKIMNKIINLNTFQASLKEIERF